jgi:hypothetical protein
MIEGEEKWVWLCVLIIDFEWIDSIKVTSAKSELKEKLFIFGCIHVKVIWTINLSLKSNSRIKSTKLWGAFEKCDFEY